MALTIKENTKIAVMKEVTEGTFVPAASGGDFIGVLSDGVELTPTKDLLERDVLTGSIGKVVPRTGMRSVAGSIGVELKAGQAPGDAPEASPMLESALGATRNQASDIVTKSSGNTASVLQIADADIGKLAVGDIVLIKMAGAYHVSPIISKTTGTGTATATLLLPHPSGDITDSAHIAPFRTYYTANTGHPTLSISKYVESAVFEKGIGCRVGTMALQNYSTGALPSLSFGFEGLNFDRTLAAPAYTPSLDTSLPPVVLNACVYMDTDDIQMNEVAFSVENTIAFATSTCSTTGRISGRVSERKVSGTLNPYKDDADLTQYNRFTAGTQFSLFSYAYNPTGVDGEFNQVVAFYMPKCVVSELGESDQDGILQDAISFVASRGTDGATEEIYMGFI